MLPENTDKLKGGDVTSTMGPRKYVSKRYKVKQMPKNSQDGVIRKSIEGRTG